MQKPDEQMRESKEAIDAAPLRSRSDAELYDRYGAVIFAYLLLYTSSQEDAEDLTLEVFTIALEHDNLPELNEKEQLAWLRRVAHHKLVDRYRRLKRHPSVMLEQVQEILRADEAHNPEHIVIRREEVGRLHQAIHNLSVLQQQVLHLRFGAGLRFAEIAVLLNKREAALRQLLSRTLALLRTFYDE